jgi:hypothetical protein
MVGRDLSMSEEFNLEAGTDLSVGEKFSIEGLADGRIPPQFWLWADIDGKGKQWRLAIFNNEEIEFPFVDFAENAAVFEGYPIISIYLSLRGLRI